MFTGIIENVGTVRRLTQRGNYRVLAIKSSADLSGMQLGESVACDGACLTVVDIEPETFVVEASQETVQRTIVGSYTIGSSVNLERALKADARLGGHFVTGHVDDVGRVSYVKQVGDSLELAVSFDSRFDQYVVDKGSIAINGASLTVNRVSPGELAVNLIPYTVSGTTLGSLRMSHKVNLEFDLIGKYIARALQTTGSRRLSKEKLIDSGW